MRGRRAHTAQRADAPRRLAAPAFTAAAGLAGCLAVAARDPHVPGSWGYCPFLLLTGLPCPLCGGLRAVADLEHGRIVDALSANLLVVAAVVLGGFSVGWWGVRRAAGTGTEPFPMTGRPGSVRLAAVLVVVLAAVFGVARWLPPFAWAAP